MEKPPIVLLTESLAEHKKKAITAMKGGDVMAAKKAIALSADLVALARIEKRLTANYYDLGAPAVK